MTTLKALFGGPLIGDALVRYIYSDEAGTSDDEPITVVVGIIIHADTQWRPAEENIRRLFQLIPEKFRTGFVSHATSIWNDHKYRDDWPREDRMQFLCHLASLPRLSGMGLAWAATRRDSAVKLVDGYTKEQIQHAETFARCLAYADQYIREACEPNEIATVVAEDVDKRKQLLRRVFEFIRSNPQTISGPRVIHARTDAGIEYRLSDITHQISKIVDTVHFVAKDQAVMLQLADICAFSLRRYFAGLSEGERLVQAMAGKLPSIPLPEHLAGGIFGTKPIRI